MSENKKNTPVKKMSAAQKAAKQNIIRNLRNRSTNSKIHTLTKTFRAAILNKDQDKVTQAFKTVQSALAKARKSGTLKRNTVARRTSILAKEFKSFALGGQ